jgi:simple sugar transport system permease protein
LPYVTVPGISDAMVNLNNQHIFVISDVAGLLAALTTKVSALTIIIVVLVLATAWILWRTSFGLRLRSCGESPAAAESLGVNVYRYKYIAVIISGALAGLGGAFLALVASSGFVTNQTGGRGYIGLAAMIFGNWRPLGTVGASVMFGYTDALRLRTPEAVHALLLLVALGLIAYAGLKLYQGARRSAVVMGVLGIGFLLWYLLTDTVPRDFTGMTPYVVTLLVLSLASQRLRMPAADGQVYRKGSAG